jgi:hypothetical protein
LANPVDPEPSDHPGVVVGVVDVAGVVDVVVDVVVVVVVVGSNSSTRVVKRTVTRSPGASAAS